MIYIYSTIKNLKLVTGRGVGFEDVISILKSQGALTVLDHPNRKKYSHQKIYVVEIQGYISLVPFEKRKACIQLKTAYPSRRMGRFWRQKSEELRLARETVANPLKKDVNINIRLPRYDVEGLKRIAVREGMLYQTLISSILHKYVRHNLEN